MAEEVNLSRRKKVGHEEVDELLDTMWRRFKRRDFEPHYPRVPFFDPSPFRIYGLFHHNVDIDLFPNLNYSELGLNKRLEKWELKRKLEDYLGPGASVQYSVYKPGTRDYVEGMSINITIPKVPLWASEERKKAAMSQLTRLARITNEFYKMEKRWR